MKFEVKYISPEVAEKMLATNPNNRKINHNRVVSLANQMRLGKWQLNGESIIVSDTGKLLDGQHRLWAILDYGAPVQMCVASGVPDDSFQTIDTGRPRSSSDIAGMLGIANANLAMSSSALIWRLYYGEVVTANCPPQFSMKVYERYQSIERWATIVSGWGGQVVLAPSTLVCALTYLEEIANAPLLAKRFASGIYKGESMAEGDPVLTLRNRVIQMRIQRKPISAPATWSLIARTLTSLERGEQLLRLNVEVLGGTMKRPADMPAHMKTLPDRLRLNDLEPAVRLNGRTYIARNKKVTKLTAVK